MSNTRIIVALTVMLAAVIAVSGQSKNPGPKATVQDFYRFDSTASQTFDRQNVEDRKKWFSAGLNSLLQTELDRQADFLKANPTDKPHFGDGLPFRPLDEACESNGEVYSRALSVVRSSVKGSVAKVFVAFKYPKSCALPDVSYEISLVKEGGRWVIDDMRASDEKDSLVDDLKRSEY